MDNRKLLNAILRRDFPAFVQRCFQTVVPGQNYLHSWHIEAIAHHLEACRRGEIRRLIITLPPRSLKSLCASVAFPAFLLGHDPGARIICASYSQDLALKLARDCRRVMQSAWYRQVFPRTRSIRARTPRPSSRPLPWATASPPRSAARSPGVAATSSSSMIR